MLTRSQAIRSHRKLWRWLAENPFAYKREWPGWKQNGGFYKRCRSNCFLCEYVDQNRNKENNLIPCPLDWSPGTSCQNNLDYLLWETRNGTEEEISQAARNIAKLPRRKKERRKNVNR